MTLLNHAIAPLLHTAPYSTKRDIRVIQKFMQVLTGAVKDASRNPGTKRNEFVASTSTPKLQSFIFAMVLTCILAARGEVA